MVLVPVLNRLRSALVHYTCKRHFSEYSLLTICNIISVLLVEIRSKDISEE